MVSRHRWGPQTHQAVQWQITKGQLLITKRKSPEPKLIMWNGSKLFKCVIHCSAAPNVAHMEILFCFNNRSAALHHHQGSCILPRSLFLRDHFSLKPLLSFFELLRISMPCYPQAERLLRATEQSRVPSVYLSRSAFPCRDVRHSSALLWFCSSYLPSPSLKLIPPSLSPSLSGSVHGRGGVDAGGEPQELESEEGRLQEALLCTAYWRPQHTFKSKTSQGITGFLLCWKITFQKVF